MLEEQSQNENETVMTDEEFEEYVNQEVEEDYFSIDLDIEKDIELLDLNIPEVETFKTILNEETNYD